MFYDFEANGFNMGFNVATKGGAFGNTSEGQSQEEIAYGVHAGYAIGGFRMNAAYQADNQGYGALVARDSNGNLSLTDTMFGSDKEWGVGMAYKFNMFEVGATYAEAKATGDLTAFAQKMKTMGGYVTADVTANDSLYVRYLEKRLSINNPTLADTKTKVISGGYKHDLSKRTSVYFDIARYSASDVKDSTQYDIAMRHSF
jgi:predicted porin